MLEFCPACQNKVKQQKGLEQLDLQTQVSQLENMGFEVFLIGPRYLPLTHGSWTDDYNIFSQSQDKQPLGGKYPEFQELVCPGPWCRDDIDMFAADLFAMRSSHPRALEIKLLL